MTLIDEAHTILDEGLAYDPSHVFLLVSGGNDSMTLAHVLKDRPEVSAIVHVDTGIKVNAVEPFVREKAEAWGIPLLVYRAVENTKADGTPDPKIYEELVAKHGFPGPYSHQFMYSNLKERQIARLMRDHNEDKRDVVLISGVRKGESARRERNVKRVQRKGRQVWVAPLMNWSDEDMVVYRKAMNVPESPVAAKLGMSGECLCGAFAKPGQLALLEEHYPDAAAEIKRIEAKAYCPWGWEQQPDTQWFEALAGQGALPFSPLCTDCIRRAS